MRTTQRICLLLYLIVFVWMCTACHNPERTPFRVRYLMKQLKHKQAYSRWKAAQQIGKMGVKAKSAAPALVRTLSDPHWLVRAYAAHALSQLGPAGVDAIFQHLKTTHITASSNPNTALVQVVLQMEDRLQKKLYTRILKNEGRARSWALDALALLDQKAASFFKALLHHKTNDIRASTIRSLRGHLKLARHFQKRIMKCTQDHSAYVRRQAVHTLRKLHVQSPQMKRRLQHLLLHDNSIRVRIEAARSLAALKIRSAPSVAALLHLLKEPTAMTFFQYQMLEPIGILTQLLPVQEHALVQRVVQHLTTLLQHRMASLRLRSVGALRTIGIRARPALVSLVSLARSTPHLRQYIARALRSITRAKEQKMLFRSTDPQTRSLAVQLFSPALLKQTFSSLQKEPVPEVRLQAFKRWLQPTMRTFYIRHRAYFIRQAQQEKKASLQALFIQLFAQHGLTSHSAMRLKQPTSAPSSRPTSQPKTVSQTLKTEAEMYIRKALKSPSQSVFEAGIALWKQWRGRSTRITQEVIQATQSSSSPKRLRILWSALRTTQTIIPTSLLEQIQRQSKRRTLELDAYALLREHLNAMKQEQRKKLYTWCTMVLLRGKHASTKERREAQKVLFALYQKRTDSTALAHQLEQLVQSWQTHPKGIFRAWSWQMLRWLTPSKRKTYLKQAAKSLQYDPEPSVRLAAGRRLSEWMRPPKRWKRAWLKAAIDERADIRLLALENLRKTKVTFLEFPVLKYLVWARQPIGESRAIERIGQMGIQAQDALPLLLRRMSAKAWYTRVNILHAVMRIAPKNARVQDALRKAQKDTDSRVRTAAKKLLSTL